MATAAPPGATHEVERDEVEVGTLKRPTLLGRAVADLRGLWRFRALLRALTGAQLRTENVGTVFGYLWWLLDPLFLMAAFYVMVGIAFRQGGEKTALFIFVSVVVWKFFSAAVRNAQALTLEKERQMRHVAFPRTILPHPRSSPRPFDFASGSSFCWGRSLR